MSLFLSDYTNHFRQDFIEMMKREDVAKCYNVAIAHLSQFAESECLADRREPGSQAFLSRIRLLDLRGANRGIRFQERMQRYSMYRDLWTM